MQKIVPNLWFDQNIDQAADFYASALPNAHVQEGFSHPDTGEAITTDVVIDDYRITLINGGPYATPNSSISFFFSISILPSAKMPRPTSNACGTRSPQTVKSSWNWVNTLLASSTVG